MQVAVISAIANFNGKNPNFKNKLVEQEKQNNSDRSFAEILADARRKLNGNITTNRM